MKLRTRYTLLISSLVLFSVFTLSVAMLILFDNASQKITNLNERVITQEFTSRMVRRSEVLTDELARNLAQPLYNYDNIMIQQLSEVSLANDDVSSIRIFDLTNNFLETLNHPVFGKAANLSGEVRAALEAKQKIRWEEDDQFGLLQPIVIDGEVIGGVEMIFSMSSVRQDIALMRRQSESQEQQNIVSFIQTWIALTVLVLVISSVFAQVITNRLTRPIMKLVNFASIIGRGGYDKRIDIDRTDEIGTLASALNEMVESLEERSHRIQHLAYHDHLTNIPNRLFFTEILEQWIETSRSHKGRFALLFMDLDGFKKVNDTYGHEVGDELICHVSARVQNTISNEFQGLENLSKPVIARLGGDEFVCLVETHNPTDAAPLARAIIDSIARPYRIRGFDIYISSSIGIATFPEDGNSASNLMKRADIAMYSAKNAGKQDYHFFSREMDKHAHDKVTLENELRHGIQNKEMELWFQPIINLATNQVAAAEVLIRWKNPKRGFVPPDAFIPIAEETGLIIPLGQWVLEQACQQIQEWQNILPEDFHLTVNVSAIQIKQRTLVSSIEKVIQDSNIERHQLHVEVTETALIEDEQSALSVLGALKKQGVEVWLDDFGTGYSSLSHLKKFPVTGIKIDRSFVSDIDKDADDRVLTNAMIAMAGAIGLNVIAEGIETENQLSLLREQSCSLGQGYLFSRPLPAAQFSNYISDQQATAIGQ